jgi:Ca2+-binding EF-hand superfamily protein
MKLTRTMLIAGSAAALALGSAFAADKQAKNADPGFNKLDRDNDGVLSHSEAARNPYLAKRFKEADRNGDGKLSRTEYLAVMTKKDVGTVKDKVAGNKDSRAGAGSSKAKSDDPGFNNLDKNHDGALSRSEAAGNPYLVQRFKEADRNGDGKLSRAEYLTAMTKKDARTVKDKVAGDKHESSASAGGTKSK